MMWKAPLREGTSIICTVWPLTLILVLTAPNVEISLIKSYLAQLLTFYRKELSLVNLNSQGGVRKASLDLKLLVEAGVIAVRECKLLNNLILVAVFLDVESLRQEQSVGNVVVSQKLGQGLLAKGTEKEELEFGR